MTDALGIVRAILSVSMPGVRPEPGKPDDAEARAMARELNEFTAGVVRDQPARFGFFATLTLPDVDGALAEAAHALDALGAAGVILLANTQGHYLSRPEDEPLFAELDRRRAVVFVHPSTLPGPSVPGVPPFAAWPYAPAPALAYFTAQLDAYGPLDTDGHAAIDHRNATSLFGKEA